MAGFRGFKLMEINSNWFSRDLDLKESTGYVHHSNAPLGVFVFGILLPRSLGR